MDKTFHKFCIFNYWIKNIDLVDSIDYYPRIITIITNGNNKIRLFFVYLNYESDLIASGRLSITHL